ncbi:diketogulonate reductase-like aldo/keto reductase [Collimonas sp. PA-H2]|uniref:aldo/keto reductase n=1 Tax=Collimonas sp. PA-H2 TaxID=1881062 RepID=UPI000BF3EE48|nr:aldo/keto reductase [Collimonas sp. PA-H2]PFH10260.1 diketogulonate reductase-like aldo/keto reductase [Collimonas sp. PA-H2]
MSTTSLYSPIASAALAIGGAHLPRLGFGTYGMSGPRLEEILVAALRHGFRHIDTAQMYQNEADVGAAIRASGIPRHDIFVTTKVWVDNYPAERFSASVDQSLLNLQSDHIDLLLVHWPRGSVSIAEQIEGLNRSVDAGKVRHIGVSNFNADMMQSAIKLSRHPIVTNQVEYHPFLDQSVLLKAVDVNKTSLMAYCGMALGRVFESPVLKEIAARNERTIAQIVLRWLIQQPHIVALSRTEKIERIVDNVRVFDFELSQEDMQTIATLRSPGSRIVSPPHLAPAWD